MMDFVMCGHLMQCNKKKIYRMAISKCECCDKGTSERERAWLIHCVLSRGCIRYHNTPPLLGTNTTFVGTS